MNNKERNKAAKKLRGRHNIHQIQKRYGKKKYENRARREEALIESAINVPTCSSNGAADKTDAAANGTRQSANITTQKKAYTLSVALPGSILNNAQGTEFATYVAGEIARACCVFCVDEIVVYDEAARLTDNHLDAYYSGAWTGKEHMTASNVECNLNLARILEYMECPQYLRKALFPVQHALRHAGLLNPLNAMHHLLATDRDIAYRDGIVVDRTTKPGAGSLCNVGLKKDLELLDGKVLPPYTRVTVHIEDLQTAKKRYHGRLISPRTIRDTAGIYWGYTVRIAKCLSDAVAKDYDIVIGTSERGAPIHAYQPPLSPPPSQSASSAKTRVLVVFGGVGGLEEAVVCDESISVERPDEYFDTYLNTLPDQGSRTIRTEEAIPITLTALKLKLDGHF